MNKNVLYLAFLLCLIGTITAVARYMNNDISILPRVSSDYWEVEVQIELEQENNIKIALPIPSKDTGAKIIDESFSANRLGLISLEEQNERKLVWAGKLEDEGPFILYYNVVLKKGSSKLTPPSYFVKNPPQINILNKTEVKKVKSFLSKLDPKTSDNDKISIIHECFLNRNCKDFDFLYDKRHSSKTMNKILVQVLNLAKIRAYLVRGFAPDKADSSASFYYWVKVLKNQKLSNLYLDNDKSKTVLFWDFVNGSNKEDSYRNVKINYSIVPINNSNLFTTKSKQRNISTFWNFFSLNTLPVSVQASYRSMLLIPLGALILTIIRVVVGIQTYGTFMPVLIALSLQMTGLVHGLLLLSMIVFSGLAARGLLSYLRLLLVARLSAMLAIVVLIVLLFSRLAYETGTTDAYTFSFFPVIILTMLIERMSIVWEETGAKKALVTLLNSLIAAILIYLVISLKHIQYWIVNFPELSLIVIAITLLLGRYTSYRLTELYRFRYFLKND